jgi:uncharacterized protein (TIGR02452 family)
MSRDRRAALARETLGIVEAAGYVDSHGRRVNIARELHRCLTDVKVLLPADLDARRARLADVERTATVLEVTGETTLAACARLRARGFARVGALNFASARNPGGGFLGGSQAQEESLARSSALHASLTRPIATDLFYEYHRAEPSLLYSDRLVVSPHCPVFRDDAGTLLDAPFTTTFLTCAAPNARALAEREPAALARLPETFARRAAGVLAAAATEGCDALVLGAWGCGVFGNDPALVAEVFRALLLDDGEFRGRFAHVSFAILDTTSHQACRRAFDAAFSAHGSDRPTT